MRLSGSDEVVSIAPPRLFSEGMPRSPAPVATVTLPMFSEMTARCGVRPVMLP
jgi:hypothetical protein